MLDHDEEAEALLVGHAGEGVVGVDVGEVRHQRRQPRSLLESHDVVRQTLPPDAGEERGTGECGGEIEIEGVRRSEVVAAIDRRLFSK